MTIKPLERQVLYLRGKKLFQSIFIVISIFSILVTGTLGFLIVTNIDGLGRAVKVVSLIKFQALEPVTTAQLIEGATSGLVSALHDPYSVYLEPKKYESLQEHISGEYGGVGLLITIDPETERLTVVSPFKGTPAARAGIVAGDVIAKIDDQDTVDMDLETAASLMQGEPGTEVVLTIYRAGQDLKEYKIIREIIQIPSVSGQIIEEYPQIAYINISMFNEHTAGELAETINQLTQDKFKAVVLDLRHNPGGALDAAVDVASYFIPKGPVVYIVNRYHQVAKNTRAVEKLDVPLAVLVNEGSASASEIVAGAIKDTGSGIIVGEKTFGKGLVQTVFPLTGNAAVKLTTAKYLTPKKRDINRKGIEPDYQVVLSPEEEARVLADAPDVAKDPQLRKAADLLMAQLAQ